MKRYHPLHVALHWIIAIMILVALLIGGPSLSELKSTDPLKMTALPGHMIWGLVIGVLMVVRLIVRMRSQKPPHADAGHAGLNFGAQVAHTLIYVLVFAMVGSGIAIAFSADLFAITFGGSGQPLPEDLSVFTARVVHGAIGSILLGFVALHVIGWAYHQFFLKDGLISRMWFGKRTD